MALVSFASAKGAPGVTTAALAVGAFWPRPVVVADCDLTGGDLALRLPAANGLPVNRDLGLLSLASLARRGLHPAAVTEHLQTLAGGLEILAGFRTAEQAAAVPGLWQQLGSALDALPGHDVIADAGRLTGNPTVLPLLRASRLVVLLVRPQVGAVVALRDRITALAEALHSDAVDGVPIGVVDIADPRDSRAAGVVRSVLDRYEPPAQYLGQLALDQKGAALFEGHLEAPARRSLLVRSARELAARIASGLATTADELPPIEVGR